MNQLLQHQDKTHAHPHLADQTACAVNLTVKQHARVPLVSLVHLQIVALNATPLKTVQVICRALHKNVEIPARILVELMLNAMFETIPLFVLA
jgi:hypothetical protein